MVKKLVWAASLLAAASPALAQTSPRELVEMTDFSGLAASPDGRWLLYRRERPSTVSGHIETGWYIVAADGASPPRYLGDGGPASWNGTGLVEPGAAQWAPDSARFYIKATINGATGLWEGRPDGAFAPFLVGDADIERFAISAAGALIYETGPSRAAIERAEEAERDDGILVDARVDLAQTLFRGAMIAGRPASQRLNGDWFDREALLARVPRRIHARLLANGEDRPATADEAKLLTPAQAELAEAAERATVAQGICAKAEGCDSDSGIRLWRHVELGDGRFALTTRDRRISQNALLWDPAKGLRPLLTTEGLLGGGGENAPCAGTREALFCVAESAATPPHLLRIALADGATQILDMPNLLPDRDDLLTEAIEWRV